MAAEQKSIPFMPGDVVVDGKTTRDGREVLDRDRTVVNSFGQINVRDHLPGEKSQDWVTYDHNLERKNGVEANAVMTLPVIENEDPKKAAVVLVEFRPYGKGGETTSLEAPGSIIKEGQTPDDTLKRTLEGQGITYGEMVFDTGTVDEISGRTRNLTATTEGVISGIKPDKEYDEKGRRVLSLVDADKLVSDGTITNAITRDLIRGAARARGIEPPPRTSRAKAV